MKYGDGMMPASGRPDIARETAIEWAKDAGCEASIFIFGRRGYFRDSMGKSGANDRSVYDDAFGIVAPDYFAVFNANTDPAGRGGKLGSLVPGVYDYKLGLHHPGTPKEAECLVQAGPVTLHRDNGVSETGEFYVHVHCGFFNETGSLACQTIPPTQWSAKKLEELGIAADGALFLDDVKRVMAQYGLTKIRLVLTARTDADS